MLEYAVSQDGGTGIRVGLKNPWRQLLEGSIPSLGTSIKGNEMVNLGREYLAPSADNSAGSDKDKEPSGNVILIVENAPIPHKMLLDRLAKTSQRPAIEGGHRIEEAIN